MPWVDVDGSDIHYIEEGEGQALVFLHGFMSCSEAWFQQFAFFRDRFRVVAYDSVNHGMSSNSPRDQDEPNRVDELIGFLSALDIEAPVLIGNSMGGNTLLHWAGRYPDRARTLIPSGSAGGHNLTRGMNIPTRAAIDEGTLLLPIGDALTKDFREHKQELYARYVRMRSTASSIENRRHPRTRPPSAAADRDRFSDNLKAITSPVMLVVGTLDRALENVHGLHKELVGARCEAIEGAPHNVYYEAAGAYNAVVGRFLSEVL